MAGVNYDYSDGKVTMIAGGTIAEGAACKLDSTAGQVVVTTSATAADVFGIALNAAASGEAVGLQTQRGSVCRALLNGTTDIAVGDKLVPTTAGQLIKTTTTGNTYCAVAMQAATEASYPTQVYLMDGVIP